MVEGGLAGFISFKYDLLLGESDHWTNNLRKVLDEASIEVAEANEGLHLGEVIGCRSFHYCLYLS